MIFTILFSTYILQPLQAVFNINYRIIKFQLALITGIILFILSNIMFNTFKKFVGYRKDSHSSENFLERQNSKLSSNGDRKTQSKERGKDKLIVGGATSSSRNQPPGSTGLLAPTETKVRRKLSAPGNAVRPVTVYGGGGVGIGLQNKPIYRSALGKIQTGKVAVAAHCKTAYHPLVGLNSQNISEELHVQRHSMLNCSSQFFPTSVEENKDKQNGEGRDNKDTNLDSTSCSDDESSNENEDRADFPPVLKPRLSLKDREEEMTEDSGIILSSPSPKKPMPKPRTKFNLVPTPKPRYKFNLEPVPNQQSHVMIHIDTPQNSPNVCEADDENVSQDDVVLYSVQPPRPVSPLPPLPKKFNRNAIRLKNSSSPLLHGPILYTNSYHG